MLKLILGKTRSGKTSRITGKISADVKSGKSNIYLIVPEQFSHEAERELCRVCGETLSLHAEVLSFTSFARKVRMQVGGVSASLMDKGGKLLCMGLAMQTVGSRLEIFKDAALKPEFQSMILSASDEMKLAGIGPEKMQEAAAMCRGELAGKLRDLAVITEAYNAIISDGNADPADSLAFLVAQLPKSRMTKGCTYYLDGFTDFTGAERKVIDTLLENGADLTVCLTVDSLSSTNEIFSISRMSALQLQRMAANHGIETDVEYCEGESVSPAAVFAENVFSYSPGKQLSSSFAELYSADSITAECEFAAAKTLELVREKNYRWRDIAVAVRGFEDYRVILEHVFEQYGVPLFAAGKTSLSAKPLPALISLAYEITENGWRPDDIISYLGTGITGLSPEECDILADYVFKWQLFENSWMSDSEWHQHPDGYGKKYDDAAEQRLNEINSLRRKIADPLIKFKKANMASRTAGNHAKALASFLADVGVAKILAEKAEKAVKNGNRALAMEDSQLWGILVSALEQMNSIAGGMPAETEIFAKLFMLMLSQYDIGIIPASLDRVSAGDFNRMRRRNIRHLIVLGAEDDRLPGPESENGIFTVDEREQLETADIILGAGNGTEIWREFTLIYHCISLPSEGMSITYPLFSISGDETRKSIVLTQAEKIFGRETKHIDLAYVRASAVAPAMYLALQAQSPAGAAARKFFENEMPGTLSRLREKAALSRGTLSENSVDLLYGKTFRMSASRAESFFSCKYGFFCKYGMKAERYTAIEFTPAEVGTFVHYVLENVAKAVENEGGFHCIGKERLIELTDSFIENYIREELNELKEKTERFKYILKRICGDIREIVLDTAEELRNSRFVPVAFELNFGGNGFFRPIRLNGKDSISLSGIADRIDAWKTEEKTYLRVVDYKTGKKKFSMEDIWYGRNMQMILYLYSLSSDRAGTSGALSITEKTDFAPAGVMYVPAHHNYVSLDDRTDIETRAEKERRKNLKRTGIVLDADGVPEAWDTSSEKLFIPSDTGRSKKEDKAKLDNEQFSVLFSHVKNKMNEMAEGIRSGSIEADPYESYSGDSPCTYCEYSGKCGFSDGENGEHIRVLPKIDNDGVWEKMREESECNG